MTKTTTKTATATKTASKAATTATALFASQLKNWPKQAGAKVTGDQISTASGLCKRTGTSKHLALAMYLRPQGATQGEVVIASGDTQVNAYSDAIKLGLAVAVPVERRDGHKVYKLELAKPKAAKQRQTRKPRVRAEKQADKPADSAATGNA